ncbi:MAG TPA: hypothetical protein VGB77_02420, partial [Abditibacteriaceae bacterium]
MPTPKATTTQNSKAPSGDLSAVAQRIAQEVERSDETGQKTTLRRLLKRCGYQKRNAQTVRRVAAALDAAGIQCSPPPAGVEDIDGPIHLQSAAPRKAGKAAAEKTKTSSANLKDQTTQKATAKAVSKAAKAVSKARTSKSLPKSGTPVFASLEEMLAHARAATVLIKLADGHGSGLVIDPGGIVLTARHVVEDSEEVCLRFED